MKNIFIALKSLFNRKKTSSEDIFGTPKQDFMHNDNVEYYFRKRKPDNSFQVVSDRTCADLDVDELFAYIDRTKTRIGQQFLYDRIRTIPEKSYYDENREKIIDKFLSDSDFREKIESLLSKLDNNDNYYVSRLLYGDPVKLPGWYSFVKFIPIILLLTFISVFFCSKMMYLFLFIIVINMFIHFQNKNYVQQYIVSIPQLLKLNFIVRNLKNFGYFDVVNPEISKSISEIDKLKKRMWFFSLEKPLDSEIMSLAYGIMEIFKIVTLAEPILFKGILKQLELKKESIEGLFCYLGEIDSLYSIASLRKGQTIWCRPEIRTNDKGFEACGLFHPLINDCVPNDISIENKSIIITGSNMSGKTSFMRSIGVNMLTGLTLNTCFATSFTFPFSKLFSVIRINDSLLNKKSYYLEETIAIKEIIQESDSENYNIFILDEIFKGTNTIERIAAAKAVLSYIAKSNNLVFVTTHDSKLVQLLEDEYDFYYFCESVSDDEIQFDYKLHKGINSSGNAIKILKMNQYPESVVKEAFEVAEKLIHEDDVLK